MLNRLVAQNVVKTPFKGDPFFAINKKMLAYSIEKAIKIKTFQKNVDDIQLCLQANAHVKSFSLSMNKQWIFTISQKNVLEVFALDVMNKHTSKKLISVSDIVFVKQINQTLILKDIDSHFKVLPFSKLIQAQQKGSQIKINSSQLNGLMKAQKTATILQSSQCQGVYISTSKNSVILEQSEDRTKTVVFNKKKTNKLEKSLEIDYLRNPIAVYKDKFAFQFSQNNKEEGDLLEIYDISEAKLRGQIKTEGILKFAKIQQNMLLLIMNVQNTDYFWFYMLNPKHTDESSIITHRAVYQKGKGDYYDFVNMLTTEAQSFGDKKKQIISNVLPEVLSNETSSVIYVLNKLKEKTEIIKLDHSKVFDSPYHQNKLSTQVVLNNVANNIEQENNQQSAQNQRSRIKSTVDHTLHKKSYEDSQKKFVQALIDTKIRAMMRKFDQLEQRVDRLEKTMRSIYLKMEENIKNINRDEVKESVNQLFQQLTPQFEKYFSELFQQVSGVLDQGVSYYNKKLASEAELHKQALTEIVTSTYDKTEQIIKLSKKEEKLSENSERHLKNLVQSRNEWQKKTDDFEQKNKEMLFTAKGPKQSGDGKIFVRADLNPSWKKQT